MRYTISQPHSGAQPTAAGHVYINQFVLVYVVTIHANISQITPNCPRGFIPTRRGACCPGLLLGRPQEGLEVPKSSCYTHSARGRRKPTLSDLNSVEIVKISDGSVSVQIK